MKVIFYILCLFFFAFYSSSLKVNHFRGVAMEMPYHIQVGGSLSRQQEVDIKSIIATSFAFIHNCFDHWNPNSELSLLNQLPILEKKKLSPRLLQLFIETDLIIRVGQERFNPALGVIISLWKSKATNAEKVDLATIESIRKNLSLRHFSLQEGIFCKSLPLQLNFDGIAKGFGIDLILERLQLSGYKNLYVEWAGDIAVSGHHPTGRKWQIAIKDPISSHPDTEIIPLFNEAIATSGDYEQYWEIEDKQYSHIINPDTLYPMEIKEGSIAGVSVIAPSCACADALATSAMTFSNITDLVRWAHTVKKVMPNVSFWIFIRDYSKSPLQKKKYKI